MTFADLVREMEAAILARGGGRFEERDLLDDVRHSIQKFAAMQCSGSTRSPTSLQRGGTGDDALSGDARSRGAHDHRAVAA